MTTTTGRLKLGYILPTNEGGRDDPRPGRLSRYAELRAMAQTAEAVGFDAVVAADHFLHRTAGSLPIATEPGQARGTWEVFTILSALAEATNRVELGPMVTATPFRAPAVLAKIAETLDEVSGGRLLLAIGAGGNEHDFGPFGFPFDHRIARFEEAVQILAPLLRTGRVDFQGTYYQVSDSELRPRGPRPSGPPIWIAGFGPRMMRLAARYADGHNTAWHMTTETAAAQLAMLDDACRAEGRDPASITRTIGTLITLPDADGKLAGQLGGAITGTADEVAARLLAFHELGASYVFCRIEPFGPAGIERFAPVIEAVRRAGG